MRRILPSYSSFQYYAGMQPIRTTSDNAFAYDTVLRRMPTNIRNIVATHPTFSGEIKTALEDLASGIAENRAIPRLELPAFDFEYWSAAFDRRSGRSWHDTEWFFGETYGFRLILQAMRFFETQIDPFRPMKERELSSLSAFRPITQFFGEGGPGEELLTGEEPPLLAGGRIPATESQHHDGGSQVPLAETRPFSPRLHRSLRHDLVADAIHLCIWGNRADISFTAGGELDHSGGERELLVADDTDPAAEILLAPKGPVHIVMDNSGAELAGDLILTWVLLALTETHVILHPKAYPTYVSDTTVADVHIWLERASQQKNPLLNRFAAEIGAALAHGRIRLAPDHFWCEAEFLTEMPERLSTLFADAGMVIVKGDFNYRRWARDTIWKAGTPLQEAIGLSTPQPTWLFLRTMKSDCLAGGNAQRIQELDRSEPEWRTKGRYGVIQLVV